MNSNFEQSLALVLKSEGGFAMLPHDPGGMTNLGVTKATYEQFVGHPVDEATMRGLTPAIVAPLYKKMFWDACHCDDLPDGLDYAIFDFSVNSGASRAIKTVQKCVGATPDGVIGPMTMTAILRVNPKQLIHDLCAARLSFLQALPTWQYFGKGWGNRVAQVEKIATSMAD